MLIDELSESRDALEQVLVDLLPLQKLLGRRQLPAAVKVRRHRVLFHSQYEPKRRHFPFVDTQAPQPLALVFRVGTAAVVAVVRVSHTVHNTRRVTLTSFIKSKSQSNNFET